MTDKNYEKKYIKLIEKSSEELLSILDEATEKGFDKGSRITIVKLGMSMLLIQYQALRGEKIKQK